MKLSDSDNLVDVVFRLLEEEGDGGCSERFNERFTAKTNSQQEDIVEMNRFWRNELVKVPVNTISERECLINEIAPSDWLRHFTSQVLPTIVRWKLPKA
jgi:hypothetical protein